MRDYYIIFGLMLAWAAAMVLGGFMLEAYEKRKERERIARGS